MVWVLKRKLRCAAGCLAVALTVACSSSSDDSSSSAVGPLVAAFNAVPDVDQMTFLREEEVWSSLTYSAATPFREIDPDQYDFSFDTRLPGDETNVCQGDIDLDEAKDDNECTRAATLSANVVREHEYLIAIVGRYDDRRTVVYDKDVYTFDREDTDEDGDPEDDFAEIQVFNWSDGLGTVDVYIEPPGTNLTATQVRGVLDTDDEFHAFIDSGEYVLSLTPVGNPATPFFTSGNFTVSAQLRIAMGILDAPPHSTTDIWVSRFRDQSGVLVDRRAPTELRLAHVAPATEAVDVYVQEDYSQAFVPALARGQVTDYLQVDPDNVAAIQFDITPAGNPGTLLSREFANLLRSGRSTMFLINGSVGALDALVVRDFYHEFAHYAEIRLLNSIGRSIDFYVVPHGNNIFTSSPIDTLSAASSGDLHTLEPGSYDIVLARAGTDTHLYGPVEVQLTAGSSSTIVGVGTPDSNTAEVIFLDDL